MSPCGAVSISDIPEVPGTFLSAWHLDDCHLKEVMLTKKRFDEVEKFLRFSNSKRFPKYLEE
jgi:hypothetical protein